MSPTNFLLCSAAFAGISVLNEAPTLVTLMWNTEQCLETFLILTPLDAVYVEMLLASNNWSRPRGLLGILTMHIQPPHQRITWPKMSIVLRLNSPATSGHSSSAGSSATTFCFI